MIDRFRQLFQKAPADPGRSSWQLRPSDGQGPFTSMFQSWVPRKIEAEFYEFLREAIPVIDAAIGRLVSLDGHIVVKGNNQALVDEIQDWFDNVPVNDVQRGMQAFHQNISNEAFEQGFGLGEFIPDRKRTDIVGLRVADSKTIKFSRTNTGLKIYQQADGDREPRELKPDNLMYFSINNENQNPYGTPLMRSCEFCAQVLATIQNATLNVWERFGDPSFELIYKTNNKTDLETRRKALEDELNTAVRAKREGKSADFVRAIHKDADISIKVIGADNQILEMEVPARHVLEQIIAKTGLPPWMLGMHWSTTERLSNAELAVLLSDIATRQAAKMPLFKRLVTNLLLLRGRTWKPGDWWLEWGKVNLHDQVQQAQARFLNAQADMYYLQNAEAAGIEISIDDLALGKEVSSGIRQVKSCGCRHAGPGPRQGTKETQRTFSWPELDQLENDYEARLKADWLELQKTVTGILGFGVPKDAKAPDPETFTFTPEQRAKILDALKAFIGIYAITDPDNPITWYYGQAYSLGLIQAARMVGQERPALDLIKNREIFEQLVGEGFTRVKNQATKAIVDRILPEMEAYVITGSNPVEVAARLEKLFSDANSNWERLARSELSMAAETAKLKEWAEWDVAMVEFIPAPDACSICTALAGDYPIAETPIPVADTHPRCRCATTPAASEVDR